MVVFWGPEWTPKRISSPKICASDSSRLALEARSHGRVRTRHDLVVIDVEQPQPRLLAEREPDHAAQLDELGLAEVRVEALPERVVGRAGPDDRLRVRERGLLALAVRVGRLEVQQLVVLALDEPALPTGLGALVAAVLALDAAGYVDAAELLERMVDDAVAEQGIPRVGKEPERRRHVRANGRALRPRRPLTRAAL